MNIKAATKQFETWLATQTPIEKNDLREKHTLMASDPFSFMRATYYRWVQLLAEIDSPLKTAPQVLAVGDLHIENFGTWRDALGRLAWGVNDFDEAYPLPYTYDLLRLATSVLMAIDSHSLPIGPKAACRAILSGYREGIDKGGRPFIIGDDNRWFRPMLLSVARDPGLFWDRLRALPPEKGKLPPDARKAIELAMPAPKLEYTLYHRLAGAGNLGKPRYTALANWLGGPLVREAKALTLSACAWAAGSSEGPYYQKILEGAVRSPDPLHLVSGNWIVRRLTADCRRIEIGSLGDVKEQEWLLRAMGYDTANIHLGTRTAIPAIKRYLKDFKSRALRELAQEMKRQLQRDHRTLARRSA